MRRPWAAAFVLAAAVALAGAAPEARARGARCPAAMALVEGQTCVDRWEASLVEVTARGEAPFSPHDQVRGRAVRAVSRPGAIPQAYISRDEAGEACRRANKRLCTSDEWQRACRGKKPTRFPYGDDRKSGYCNDEGKVSPLAVVFGPSSDVYGFEPMNDPRLDQVPGTVARTGSHPRCKSSYGVFDMVGNLHEWVDDKDGTFRGGYFLDTHENGDGCDYKTVAHGPTYHDYSTGFRCCADPR